MHDELPEESPWQRMVKRTLQVFVSIFLIFLVLTFLVPGNVLDIFRGQLDSYRMDAHLDVHTDFGTVTFTEEVYGSLRGMYFADEVNEFAVCLGGALDGDTYYLDSLFVPEMLEQSVFHVRFKRCPQGTLVVLHRHPYNRCLASHQDLLSFREFQATNPDAIAVVMCREDRFAFLH